MSVKRDGDDADWSKVHGASERWQRVADLTPEARPGAGRKNVHALESV